MDKPTQSLPGLSQEVTGVEPVPTEAPAKTSAKAPAKARATADWQDSTWPPQEPEPPIRPLTRDEAQALVARHPTLSPWRLLALQALMGLLVAVVWGALARSWPSFVSALYGAAVVVVPGALMARGVFSRGAGRSVAGLLTWELVKLALAAALLAMAPRWVQGLDWAAMLVTMVLCLKVIGLVLLRQGLAKKSTV